MKIPLHFWVESLNFSLNGTSLETACRWNVRECCIILLLSASCHTLEKRFEASIEEQKLAGGRKKTIMMHLNFMSRNICILFHHPNALGAKFFHLYSQAWHNSNKHDFKTFLASTPLPHFSPERLNASRGWLMSRVMLSSSFVQRNHPSQDVCFEVQVFCDVTHSHLPSLQPQRWLSSTADFQSGSLLITGQNSHRLSGFWEANQVKFINFLAVSNLFLFLKVRGLTEMAKTKQISSRGLN